VVEKVRALRFILFVVAIAAPAMQSTARAHQLDEYIQATLVEISPEGIRLSINMTPGAEVADQVWAAIDLDKNGKISEAEAAQYATAVRRDLDVELDHRSADAAVVMSTFPDAAAMREGTEIVQLEFDLGTGPLAAGTHTLTFKNEHMPKISAYLFNAAMPKTKAVEILRQTRNKNQSAGEIEFSIAGAAKAKFSPEQIWLMVLFGAIAVAMIKAVSRGRLRG
jgi:hypothetical protein